MTESITRRTLLAGATSATAAAPMLGGSPETAPLHDIPPSHATPFRYCLNTSTIRGQKLPLPDAIDIAARAGFQAIEPWIREIDEFVQAGGSLADLRKRLSDHGLSVVSAIGFAEWIVDDDARRARGLETARRDMELVKQIGGTHIAAPPAGATDAPVDLRFAADRYRTLLELGDRIGIIPQVEVWGFSKSLSRLGECAQVAIDSQHPKACILGDVYHLHKGGSGFAGLRLLCGATMQAIHMNDFPADPPRDQITDAHRVYPGDGVAPLTTILRDLRATGFRGALSVELFNREYWTHDAEVVARTAFEKTRAAVERAFAE